MANAITTVIVFVLVVALLWYFLSKTDRLRVSPKN
jgi:hypothetical protein